jgi:hypothetical protein
MNLVINWFFILTTSAASIGLLLSREWRWSIGFLALQYFGAFWFVLQIWPLGLAIIKLISGLVVCLILETSQAGIPSFSNPESSWPEGRLFRLFAASLIVITSLAIAPQANNWLGINNISGAWVSLFLISMGLLQLGITIQPIRVIIALLTLLSGFEILYATIETSTLVAAMLVVINLGLSLVGIYLLNPANQETSS